MPPKKATDPEFLGPYCGQINLRKSDIEASRFPSGITVKNGTIFELHRYARISKLDTITVSQWVSCLGFSHVSGLDLTSSITKLVETREKLRRGKKQNAIFLLEEETFEPVNASEHAQDVDLPVMTNAVSTAPPDSPVQASADLSGADSRDELKQLNSLAHEISKKEKHLNTLQGSAAELKEEFEAKKKHYGHYKPANVKKRDKRAEETRRERDSLKAENKALTDKVRTLSSENTRLELEVEALQTELAHLMQKTSSFYTITTEVENLRSEKLRLQKLLSYYKNKRKDPLKPCDNCHKFKKLNHSLKQECQKLQADLDEIQNNLERRISTREDNIYNDDIRLCVMELSGLEVAAAKMRPVIQTVAKHVFHQPLSDSALPHKNTAQRIIDEGHVLAKQYIGKRLHESSNWGLHKDGTSRKKKKILDTTVCIDTGETFSLGFSTVAAETGQAIANDCAQKLKEVSDEHQLPSLLTNLTYTMSDRAANEKKSNQLLEEWRTSVCDEANTASQPPLENLYCMAHVLLGFHSYSVKELKKLQFELSGTGKLGRDLQKGFKLYKSDEAASRMCQAVSDIFAPVGHHLGVRDIWEAYCMQKGIKSEIKNYKDNRFNGLFQVSAAVYYHKQDLIYILENVKDPNKKLQGLLADFQDPNLMAIMLGLGIMYIRITGPFWNSITSTEPRVSYAQIAEITKGLYSELQTCAQTPALLLNQVTFQSLKSFPLNSQLEVIIPAELDGVLTRVLSSLCKAFLACMDKQLDDILTKSANFTASFAPASNLVCEHHFGDLDSSQRRRPSATMHHHSSIQLLKRNRAGMAKWFQKMPDKERHHVLQEARQKAQKLRQLHQQQSQEELSKASEKLAKKNKAKALVKKALNRLKARKKSRCAMPLSHLPDPDERLAEGQWVVAAYQDHWYPGIIRKAESDQGFVIDFAHRCQNNTFKWPNGSDLQHVERKFIIHTTTEPYTTTKGRVWSMRNAEDIDAAFKKYYECYFS